MYLGGLSSYLGELLAHLTGNNTSAQLSLAVLRALGPGQTTALHSGAERQQDRSYRISVIDFSIVFFFLLKIEYILKNPAQVALLGPLPFQFLSLS